MAENLLFNIALSKAMNLCSNREYCREDMLGKLFSWEVGEKDANKIVEILITEKFLDESRYTLAFVRDKFKYNKWGKIKIIAHLKAKKIPVDIIKTSIESIDNESYIKQLKNIISNHKRSVKAKNQYDLKAKLFRYGLSKGFESSLLYDLLNEIDE